MIEGQYTSRGSTYLQDSIFECASVPMLILSSEGEVIKLNREARKTFTNTAKTLGDLFDMEKSGWESWKNNAKKCIEWENLLSVNAPGHSFTAKVYFNPLLDPEGGESIFLCQVHKLNASFGNQGSLDNLDYLLGELINSIPDNIFIKDKASRFILANINVARIMGVNAPGDLTGKSDFDFYPAKLAKKYRADELEVMEKGIAKLNIIEQVISSSHERKWFSTSKIPLRNSNGDIIGIMGIGRDITPLIKEKKALRKAKNEAEKADKLKSAFLANLSHEIRTPLNAILGFSQFLSQFIPPDPKATKYVEFIMKNGRRLLNTISDIIDISKIESGQLVIKKKAFSLNDLIEKLTRSAIEYAKYYEKPNLKIHSEVSLRVDDCYIYNDDQRITQAMQNLLANAIKFTPKGHINFGYKVNENNLLFFVRDSGIGIKDEDLHSIFNLFTQADDSLGRQYEGAGLGLPIAKGIVTLLDGKIGVNTSVGKGSEFFFTIPYTKYIPDKNENEEHLEGKKILILGEDSIINGIINTDPVFQKTSLDIALTKETIAEHLIAGNNRPDLIIYIIAPNENFDDNLEIYLNEHPGVHLLILSKKPPKSMFIIPEGIHAETIEEPVNPSLMIEKIKLLLKNS